MVEIQITKEMWEEWKRNPVTNLYFQQLADLRARLAEYIVSGVREQTEYAKVVGSFQALSDALNVTYTEGREPEND